jgi:hypothetical protein
MNAHNEPGDPRFDEFPLDDTLGGAWDAPDRAVDRRLRDLIGSVAPLNAPAYAFERVALRARRRRHRTAFVTAAAAVTTVAVVAGGVVAGVNLTGRAVQTTGCDTVRQAPAAWSGGERFAVAQSGYDLGREVMDRRYEWAIGGTLVAGALSFGIVAGCSGSSSKGPSASATASGGPTPSQSAGSIPLPSDTTTATSSPSANNSSSAISLPRCHTADLSPTVSIVAGSQGTGHELMNVRLTNASGHTCTVYGFPGMKLEDQNGAGQATTVTRNHGVATKTITVANGASAAATVRFDFNIPAADEPQGANCEAASVYLMITPPDETTQLSATITGGPVTVCQHGTLDVLPFISGKTGANQ